MGDIIDNSWLRNRRFVFTSRHDAGEESAVSPAVENVASLVAEAYVNDHRGLDTAFDEQDASYSAQDALKTPGLLRYPVSIPGYTWTRRILTSHGSSGNEYRCPSRGR
jgi:hypothetical protein